MQKEQGLTQNKLAEQMRKGMRYLASGVCIISTRDAAGENHAMTATSVTSVSDEPPSLLVCINRVHRIYSAFAIDSLFAVNILANEHQALSQCCADREKLDQRFNFPNWQESRDSAPALNDALACFQCVTRKMVSYGTHDVVIGDIVSVLSSGDQDVDPLLYFDGRYTKIQR